MVVAKTIDIQQHVKEVAHAAHSRSICIPPSRSCITCGYDEKSHHPSSEENIKRICSLSTSALARSVCSTSTQEAPTEMGASREDIQQTRDSRMMYAYRETEKRSTIDIRLDQWGSHHAGCYSLSLPTTIHVGAAYFVFIFGYGVAHAKRSFGWPHVL